jgi:S-adenosylmethionine:diacylglycerol 3-amino-3-carboxypropyl transferase
VDFNGAQIALTELKSIACQNLEWDHFFRIFAKNDMELLRNKYWSSFRGQLTEPSRRFWDKQIKTIKSFMYSGTSGTLAYFVCRILFRVLGLGFIRRTLCEQQSLDAFHAECRNQRGLCHDGRRPVAPARARPAPLGQLRDGVQAHLLDRHGAR